MMLKRLAVLFLLVFYGFQANATHLLGGEIVWTCKPNGKYVFTLVLYQECAPGSADIGTSPQYIATNAGGSIQCTWVSTSEVVPTCYTGTATCASATSGEGRMEKLVFRSAEIKLTGTPPASGWHFSWSSCCRPGTVDNLNNPGSTGYTLRALMFPYTPPGSTSPLTAGTAAQATCYDSSPNFLEDPQVLACTGVDITYNNLGYDPDLDSLYYDWGVPLDDGTYPPSGVSFATGYSATSPMPSGSGSTGAAIDGETGEVSFNSATAGSWATCVKIEEWRCGQLVGEVYRDIPIVTLTCTPPTGLCSSGYVDNAPSMSLTTDSSLMNPTILNPVTNVSGKVLYYETSVYPGDTVRFKISATDGPFQPNCASQLVKFSASGGNLSSAAAYNNAASCLFNPPCATLQSLNDPSSLPNASKPFESYSINEVRFNWHIDCNHLFYQEYQCGTLKSEYEFYLRMQDDQCPVNRFTYKKVIVKVKNYMPGLPDVNNSCISQDAATGAVTFDWAANPDTGFNFDYYLINHIDTLGNLTIVDTIYDWSQESYTHNGAYTTGPNSYTIQVAGGCGLVSDPTDTLSNVHLGLQSFPPPPNSSVAILNWNKWMVGNDSTDYEVWVEAPINSGNWTYIATTQDTAYNDTVAFCGEWLKYQIRFGAMACESTVDSGFFSDKTAPNPVIFDSVTVGGGNLAAMSWAESQDGDVEYYVIYKMDNSGFYQPEDSVLAVNYATAMPWTNVISNAANESETYLITAVDSCGNQSSVGNTIPSSTMYLHLGVDPCDGFARLRWNGYKTWTYTTPAAYNLYVDITDPMGGTVNGVLLKGGNLDSAFNHYNIINGYEYCYYVKAVDTSGTVFGTSNRVCSNSAVVQKSEVLYLGRASVTSQNGVDLYAYIDKEADVIDYSIQRSDDEIGPYLTIGTVVKPVMGPWEVKFVDFTADPMSRRYFYRVMSRDSCGAIDTISNLATNILLDVEAVGNLSNTLRWNAYRDFADGVEEYEIYRSIDGGSTFSFAGSTTDTVVNDNIKPFASSKGKFCYYIKAIAADGVIPWRDEFGEKFNARSNVACAVHKARIWVPSAFNPASDYAENRIWKPQGVFARTDSYTMFIQNRWGQEVFRTNDLNEGWDGKINGNDAPIGVYTYFIEYRSIEDVPVEERGTFTLVR